MEAGIVAPETGAGVDRKGGREDLGEEEEQNGKIERGAADGDLLLIDPLDDPGNTNESGQDVDEEHFVELEDLGGTRPENQGNEKEKNIEEVFDGFVSVVGEF